MVERYLSVALKALGLGSGAVATLVAAPLAMAQAGDTAYADAVNCAALTQAAGKLAEGTKEESTHFDHYVHWSMAAADLGRASGKSARAVDGEVAGRASNLMAQLKAGDGGATAQLAQCAARVPANK